MTLLEKQLVENLKNKKILEYSVKENEIEYVVAGDIPELNERITKENPTPDFIEAIKEKASVYRFVKMENELAENYVQKWLDEQSMPENESQLLQFAKYAVGMTMLAVEQSK